jgi:hypothetical protein
MKDEPGLLEERILRAALRLDADEIPARLDPRLIAAAARAARTPGTDLLAPVALALAGGAILAELSRSALGVAGSAIGPEALRVAIDALTAAARVVVPVAETVTAGAIPFAIAAIAALAIAFDQRRAQRT